MLVGVAAAEVDVVELAAELEASEAEPVAEPEPEAEAEAVAEAEELVVVEEPFARNAGMLNLVMSA